MSQTSVVPHITGITSLIQLFFSLTTIDSILAVSRYRRSERTYIAPTGGYDFMPKRDSHAASTLWP